MSARALGTDRGFTLLEVLVSLVVLGLIVAGLAGGIRFGTAAFDTQERTLASGGEIGTVDRGLRRVLAGMDPVGDGKTPPLLGAPGTITFAADLPEAVGPQAVQPGPDGQRAAMRLQVSGGRLVLVWAPAPHATPLGPAAPVTTELLPGVEAIELAYFGPAGDHGPPAWQRAWSAPALPMLVRLRLVFPRGDSRHWADIVVAPRRTAPP